ncbi:MAG TPA: gluconolactonase [Verrucomicrobiales bacterium]|nr:gluconolactonase [Verrucomicrobiales bacterium]
MKRAVFFLIAASAFAAEPEFPLTADSKPQEGVPKGTMIKGTHTASEGSVFPGTVRDYQIYLPAGFDKAKPAPFMVFQDGVIYQAPVVFDNLIAKKDIPPLVGIFIKPGVVPAANDNALPRFNRSYEYDSVTPTYSQFLIDEFLPAIEAKHGLKLSTDPNHAAIAGNSSGGICAFMAAWHRPDRFRRVFTGVGTYVGIRGADRLPVLVRKIEPKPLRVFLQSGTGDNDLYCGDWWMANQMMQRSLAWAGYDVNHAWGEGGHNQKHASQVFPDAMRWLWRGWQTDMEVKANPKGESKWKGYEVVGDGEWGNVKSKQDELYFAIASNIKGDVAVGGSSGEIEILASEGGQRSLHTIQGSVRSMVYARGDSLIVHSRSGVLETDSEVYLCTAEGKTRKLSFPLHYGETVTADFDGRVFFGAGVGLNHPVIGTVKQIGDLTFYELNLPRIMCLSPDQTHIYGLDGRHVTVRTHGDFAQIKGFQEFYLLEESDPYIYPRGPSLGRMCVDTNGWLYVATSLGIQVCDQAGRVNFILPTPKPAFDVCFGGKDLSELFIACGDTIYKRPTKAKGVVSGQQAPIKPAPPKL